MAVFEGAELALGGVVGEYLVGCYMPMGVRFLLQGLLQIGSFFVGGVIIGVFSPGVRILEPAVGAALSIAAMFTFTVFSPYTFLAMQPSKLMIGGFLAFVVALTGARLGEKITGNR